MRRPTGTVLAALLLLSACHLSPTTPKKISKSPAASQGAASPSPRASASPAGVATTGPAAVVKLAPAPETQALSGAIAIDASYVVSAGAGNIISGGAGNIISGGAGNIISGGAGNVISGGAGNIISGGAGNIISAGAGNVVAASGQIISGGAGNIVNAGGGNIISGGAGNIISGGAGNIISGGAGNYRLPGFGLLAGDPTATYGQMLPAVGLLVWVKNMSTNQPVPLGQDAKGQPVWAIYSNAEGRYEVFLPKALAQNVLVVAEVPKQQANARLGYALVASAGSSSDRTIDEDTATVTTYLRSVFRDKFRHLLNQSQEYFAGTISDEQLTAKFFQGSNASPLVMEVGGLLFKDLMGEIRANKSLRQQAPERDSDYEALATILSDLMIARGGDLEQVDLDATYYKVAPETLVDEPMRAGKALANMRTLLKRVRTATIARHAKLPAFKDTLYLQRANAFYRKAHPGFVGDRYVIEKPTDLSDFIVKEYFSLIVGASYGCSDDCPPRASLPADCTPALGCIPEGGIGDLTAKETPALSKAVMRDIGVPETTIDVLFTASLSMGAHLAFSLADAEARGDMLRLIREFRPATP